MKQQSDFVYKFVYFFLYIFGDFLDDFTESAVLRSIEWYTTHYGSYMSYVTPYSWVVSGAGVAKSSFLPQKIKKKSFFRSASNELKMGL